MGYSFCLCCLHFAEYPAWIRYVQQQINSFNIKCWASIYVFNRQCHFSPMGDREKKLSAGGLAINSNSCIYDLVGYKICLLYTSRCV